METQLVKLHGNRVITKGTEILVGNTWYVIDEVCSDCYFGIDQDGGEREITDNMITCVYAKVPAI